MELEEWAQENADILGTVVGVTNSPLSLNQEFHVFYLASMRLWQAKLLACK